MPAVGFRYHLHQLTGAEPMPAPPPVPSLPDLRPAVLFRPSVAGAKALAAADVVIANDVTDPQRCWVCKGWDVPTEGWPDGRPVLLLIVELDMDTTELPWLIAAANDLIAMPDATPTTPK